MSFNIFDIIVIHTKAWPIVYYKMSCFLSLHQFIIVTAWIIQMALKENYESEKKTVYRSLHYIPFDIIEQKMKNINPIEPTVPPEGRRK